MDFFIQTEKIIGGRGEGDGRGFESNSDPDKSRAFFYLHLDDQGKLLYVDPHWNVSCALGDCPKAFDDHIQFDATQDPDTGQIHLSWSLWNGVSSRWDRAGEEAYNAYMEGAARYGAVDEGTYYYRLGGMLIPAIDGELTLSPTMLPGNYELTYVDRDPFPSLEIYQYYNGHHQHTIATLPERSFVGNYGPMVWLHPFAPNERIMR